MLADHAEAEGFTVERGVAGMPTAFVASYGSGAPVIAILGEYDALPGISQKAQTTKEAYEAGGGGHGCGHDLFGAGSRGAAIAVKRQIEAGHLTEGDVRIAIEVDDVDGTTATLAAAGTTVVGAPFDAPWDDRIARLETPHGMQLTLFAAG